MRPRQDATVAELGLRTVIRNGTVVTAEGTCLADVDIDNGVIVRVGEVGPVTQEIDASGLLILPGAVDQHTHIDEAARLTGARSPDDWYRGTVAAACGGVTTVVDYARCPLDSPAAETIARLRQRAERAAVIDQAFHVMPYSLDAAFVDQIPALAASGYPSFKIFMSRVNHDQMREALKVARAAGALAMIHPEDPDAVERAATRLIAEGRYTARSWAEVRPREAEIEAVRHALALVEETGASVCLVHLATAEAVDMARTAKA